MTDKHARESIPTCRDVVNLITDYLENRMVDADRERFERHIAVCTGCATYLQQMRTVIGASRARPTEDVIPQAARAQLIDEFRELFR